MIREDIRADIRAAKEEARRREGVVLTPEDLDLWAATGRCDKVETMSQKYPAPKYPRFSPYTRARTEVYNIRDEDLRDRLLDCRELLWEISGVLTEVGLEIPGLGERSTPSAHPPPPSEIVDELRSFFKEMQEEIDYLDEEHERTIKEYKERIEYFMDELKGADAEIDELKSEIHKLKMRG
jgi:hypothetical protein